jgi:hypothetical protein
VQGVHVEPTGLNDGNFVVYGRWSEARMLEPEEETLFERQQESLSDRGMAALFLAPGGPAWPEPIAPSVFDDLPVPLTGGMTVRSFRNRSHEQRVLDASVERARTLDARAVAMKADPAAAAAVKRLRDRFRRREWFLLLPGVVSEGRALRLLLTGTLVGTAREHCTVRISIAVPLAGAADPADAINALFPRARTLAELHPTVR